MDRDYDGRLSFGEFMGEETPLEKVTMIIMMIVVTMVIISRCSRTWTRTAVGQ